MKNTNPSSQKMTDYRWTICALLFFATTINYLDRQVLSLTWSEFIRPEFHWTDNHYGNITAIFSMVYAVSMVFAGRMIDWLGTKKGFLWTIGIWSAGACLHALCGIATQWAVGVDSAKALEAAQAGSTLAVAIATYSMYFFIIARCVLAIGESGNFPAAIKVTAEYFPKKDRAFATSIFNSGATIGALAAPLSIPPIALYFKGIGWGNGWEMAFLIIGALGFIWMGFWAFMYEKPSKSKHVNKAELAYIEQDKIVEPAEVVVPEGKEKKLSFRQCLGFKQTWAFAFGKFMTDGVWWFFLFWLPSYLNDVYGLTPSSRTAQMLLFVLYGITMLSILGGYLPTYFVNKKKMEPYAGRMRAMLIFAFFPLLALLAQPLGSYSYWFPVIIIGIAGAAHQSWSANIFSTVGDMFPKSTVATITGIGGLAGGIGCTLINKFSGMLFTYAGETNMCFLGFEGKSGGYFIVFSYCAFAYLIGWCVMKLLVPKVEPIVID